MIFLKAFNHKLYNKYHLQLNDENKISFINDNYIELRDALHRLLQMITANMAEREYSYVKRMKNPMDVRNVSHNEYLYQMTRIDTKLFKMNTEILDIALIYEKLLNDDYKNISVDELNRILRYMNHEKHQSIALLTAFVALCMALCICSYIGRI